MDAEDLRLIDAGQHEVAASRILGRWGINYAGSDEAIERITDPALAGKLSREVCLR